MLFAFTNSKGGVGKSTLAVHSTIWLAEKGKSVVLVDADVQGSSSTWLKEVSAEAPLFRLATPDDVLEQVPKIGAEYEHVIIDGPAGLSEVIRRPSGKLMPIRCVRPGVDGRRVRLTTAR